MDRSELQRLYDRAVGNSRRYYADSRVNDLVQAVGEYLDQDDPSFVLPSPAMVAAALADGFAAWAARGEGRECWEAEAEAVLALLADQPAITESDPQRVQPSREELARAIFERRDDPYDLDEWEDCGDQELWLCYADAVLALLAAQPTVAEVRVETLREAAAVARLDRVGGLAWIARAVEAWLNARAAHIAAADREAEGGAR